MANSNNEADQGSYGGNSSLPPASGPGISLADPALGEIGVAGPGTVLGADAPIPIPAPDQTGELAVLTPLLCEQLRQFIMDTVYSAIRGSQTSGIGPSSQIERGVKEKIGHPPRTPGQSLEREVMKLHQQVTRETLPTERDPAEHIRKFENAALLHRFTDSIKCRIFLTTLMSSAQHWFDKLPAGSVRSFAKFSSLFQHQFASSQKYRKSAISLFGIKQEEREILRAYVQCFNTCRIRSPGSSSRGVGQCLYTGSTRRTPIRFTSQKISGRLFGRTSTHREVHELGGCSIGNKERKR
ncbi:UNVERIFIED_CONTAM: hypothetical protein Slati_2427000 [Sesamum latifolium]|uniref:Retrotransposon gag domain-containing protein n=1 Tax=Sesamum latifolium TaxID=2727402 RepID=A0AAW2WGY0_9LAMI